MDLACPPARRHARRFLGLDAEAQAPLGELRDQALVQVAKRRIAREASALRAVLDQDHEELRAAHRGPDVSRVPPRSENGGLSDQGKLVRSLGELGDQPSELGLVLADEASGDYPPRLERRGTKGLLEKIKSGVAIAQIVGEGDARRGRLILEILARAQENLHEGVAAELSNRFHSPEQKAPLDRFFLQ